jgi:hypothetical protein
VPPITSLREKVAYTLSHQHPLSANSVCTQEIHSVSKFTQMRALLHHAGKHHVSHGKPQSVGDWLRLCGIVLSENEILWPLYKLDELPNLRAYPDETCNQCIDWHIFRNDTTVRLPSFEMLVPTLDIGSSGDAWLLGKRIKLREARFPDFKAQLLEDKISKIRLLNVPIKEEMVKRSSQDRHLAMVRNRVQGLYCVGKEHPIEIHALTANICPPGTATDIHHDSDPHISTACGRCDACRDQPMKLWILWRASDSRLLSRCYSNTVSALEMLGPCGYIVQFSGESLMLPANVPHAALSLSPHVLYGQTFHVEGRARDPTTFELELSAGAKPSDAIDTVLTCYEEGLQDPDPQIRAIYIDHIVCNMSAERDFMRQASKEPYISRVVEVLREHRKFQGVCGLCNYLGLRSRASEDCWELHDVESEQPLPVPNRRHRPRKGKGRSDVRVELSEPGGLPCQSICHSLPHSGMYPES